MKTPLSLFLEAAKFEITEGAKFLWECFPDGWTIDCKNGSAVFSKVDQTVYEITIDTGERCYRWVNPDFEQAAREEASKKGLNWDRYIDDLDYINTESFDDIIDKVSAITEGRPFDERVVISIELDQDVIDFIYRKAHEQDITVNKFVEQILRDYLADQ